MHTDRDLAIYAQVAFKAAVDLQSSDVLDNEGSTAFEARFAYLTELLVSKIDELQAQAAPAVPTPAPANVEQALVSELGASPVGHTVEVIQTKDGGQEGPLPAWLIAEAAAKGVTKVFDNRGKIQRGEIKATNPWFKSPRDQGEIPFWPPKGR